MNWKHYEEQLSTKTDVQLFQEVKRCTALWNRDGSQDMKTKVDLCLAECRKRGKLQIFSRAQVMAETMS